MYSNNTPFIAVEVSGGDQTCTVIWRMFVMSSHTSHLWHIVCSLIRAVLFPLCCVPCRLCWSERCWSMLRVQRCGCHMAWLWSEVYSSLSWFALGLWLSCGLLITAPPHACEGQRSRLPSRKSYVCAALKISAQGRWENIHASRPMLHEACVWYILHAICSAYCFIYLHTALFLFLNLKGAVCNFPRPLKDLCKLNCNWDGNQPHLVW